MDDPRRSPDGDPSPLEVLPGLIRDRPGHDRRGDASPTSIAGSWSGTRAAERLYGIPERDALGRPIDRSSTRTIVGEGRARSGARALALNTAPGAGGSPIGRRSAGTSGRSSSSRPSSVALDGPDGEPVGVISVKRDITPCVPRRTRAGDPQLAGHGDRRGPTRATALRQRALEVLADTTGAAGGAIVVARRRSPAVIATHGLSGPASPGS